MERSEASAWPEPLPSNGGFPHNPPNNPPLAGSLAGSLPELILRDLEEVFSQPGRQPATPIVSACEFLEDRYLCVLLDPAHLLNPPHMRRVFSFLERRGVRRAAGLVRSYGALAVATISRSLEHWELEGVDWSDGLDSPGAWVHQQIRLLSGRLAQQWPDAPVR